MARDREVNRELKKRGWRVMRIWDEARRAEMVVHSTVPQGLPAVGGMIAAGARRAATITTRAEAQKPETAALSLSADRVAAE